MYPDRVGDGTQRERPVDDRRNRASLKELAQRFQILTAPRGPEILASLSLDQRSTDGAGTKRR